jgi:hypothetical protein
MSTFSYGEAQKSLILLESAVKLEYNLNAFASSYILSSMYPMNVSFKHNNIQILKEYDKVLKEISIGLKNSSQYKILVDFSKTKNFLNDLLGANADIDSKQKLLKKCRTMETEVKSIVNDKYSLLITDKNKLFAMLKIEWAAQSILREYLAMQTIAKKGSAPTKHLKQSIEAFDKMLIANNWSAPDADRINDIKTSWQILERFLLEPGFPMLVKVGTDRIDSLTGIRKNSLESSK